MLPNRHAPVTIDTGGLIEAAPATLDSALDAALCLFQVGLIAPGRPCILSADQQGRWSLPHWVTSWRARAAIRPKSPSQHASSTRVVLNRLPS